MPDVYDCVELCTKAICSDNAEIFAVKIESLKNSNKIQTLREKNRDYIETYLDNNKKFIKKYLSKEYYPENYDYTKIELFLSSKNNKKGADIYHNIISGKYAGKKIEIELKFGSETNNNKGMDIFCDIFGNNVFKEALSIEIRKSWLIQFEKESRDEELQLTRLYSQLDIAVDKFNDYCENKKWTLDKIGEINLEKYILNSTGDGLKEYDFFEKFSFKAYTPLHVQRMVTGSGTWEIEKINNWDHVTKKYRVNIKIKNIITSSEFKFVLNWKNNYKLDEKSKASAKLGLGSPSWNVFFRSL